MSRPIPACLTLGTILRDVPSHLREGGILQTIKSAYAYRYANFLWSRRTAVLVAFAANMERAESWGNGNRAARRIKAGGLA